MIRYYVPTGTEVLAHHEGDGFNLTLNFHSRMTKLDVYYGSKDVWFEPIHGYVNAHEPTILWDNNEEDDFAMVKNSMYGFEVPENNLLIDLILVVKNHVSLIQLRTPKADPRKTSVYKDARIIQRIKNNLKLQ